VGDDVGAGDGRRVERQQRKGEAVCSHGDFLPTLRPVALIRSAAGA
jgi:hypothetical protein